MGINGYGSSSGLSLFRVSVRFGFRNNGSGLNLGRVYGSTGLICGALPIVVYTLDPNNRLFALVTLFGSIF